MVLFTSKGSDVNFCKAENNWCIASSEGKPSAYLDDRYIVRFTSYKYLEEQREELVGVLGPESNGWRWIKRSNKAASHPTDFGLISLGKELLDHLQVRPITDACTYITLGALVPIIRKSFQGFCFAFGICSAAYLLGLCLYFNKLFT